MATTTFTGILRSNGNGKKTTYAGSVQMVAQFYVPATNAAAGTDAVSYTHLTLPTTD